jgi:hypothetical protein
MRRYWLAWPLLLVCPMLPVTAQRSGGVDVAVQSRQLWRGLERTRRATAVISGLGAWEEPLFALSGGMWSSVELLRSRTSDATIVGRDRWGVGEVDIYGQADALLHRRFSLTVGTVRYTFQGDEALGGHGSDDNTTELYARVNLDVFGVEQEFVWWRDVDRVRGSFLEHTLRRRLPLFPALIPPSLIASVTTGWSRSQHVDPERPAKDAHFQRAGFRYADVALTFTPLLRLPDLRVILDVATHYVVGRGDEPVAESDSPVDRTLWLEFRLRAPGVSPGGKGR